ncbi:hypothetical protein ACOSP7_021428 [Xanthoceras sorbifolium]|uniref:Legumain prodomain domain-containing protein n=1 Tax=Xanthoceras sorbifolium TaxID=99658 RepID=A0ABQ8HKB8_9ROSI|nr:hypothetical protein JRO89_XS09G0031300 [Xanthoceras sorbifolium]
MNYNYCFHAIVFLSLFISFVECQQFSFEETKLNNNNGETGIGERWAVLVAGSNTYSNYRHQADVCHAYQILKKGGLEDENIIVFMYDDIAFAGENPRPGIIINNPYGPDVYYGVPKDYTGENATADNLLGVILGNRRALTGGSGKVVDSGPDDTIFIYYADHGSPGCVSMPHGIPLYAKDLIHTLKKKYEANAYKSMVIYIEACESGSMFDGLLPNNWNIYAITAANPEEGSYAFYCDIEEYGTCLGDVFSISWMEDSDKHDMSQETLQQQYEVVKRRTGFDTPSRSHVMQYGDTSLGNQLLYTYIGRINPQITNRTFINRSLSVARKTVAVNQRDVELFYLRRKFENAREGSQQKIEVEKKLNSEISQRQYVDRGMNHIATSLFGQQNGLHLLEYVRPAGQPLVDDWDCLKMFVKIYEEKCGTLTTYGKKYTRAMANMCNFGIKEEHMNMASTKACSNEFSTPWSSLQDGVQHD